MFLAIILAALDAFGGVLLIAGSYLPYASSGFVATMGGVFITKAILLLIYGRFGGSPHYDLGAVLDMVAGLLFVAMYFSVYMFAFPVIGVLMIIKGVLGLGKNLV
jgi:hypothetical protein